MPIISVTEEQLRGIIYRALSQNKHIIVNTWKNMIPLGKQPALTNSGHARERYRFTITSKIWPFPNGKGFSLIVGKRSGTAPHAHLVEKGTVVRYRLPYQPGPRGTGHGVKGKFEFVNFRGSTVNGKPPFPARHRILLTGKMPAGNYGEKARAASQDQFLTAVGTTVLEELKSLLESQAGSNAH